MEEEKFICQYCGRQCKSKTGLSLHENSCKNNSNHITKIRSKSYATTICDKCGKEITNCNFKKHYSSCCTVKENAYHLDHDDLICKFCGKEYKNKNSLVQHECRCKENPDRQLIDLTNAHSSSSKSRHLRKLKSFVKMRYGEQLDITYEQLDAYKIDHKVCEICGKSVDELVKWDSKFAAKNLCIDHQHNTNHFRGLLCQVCNRQLGWYENNKDKVDEYLTRNI